MGPLGTTLGAIIGGLLAGALSDLIGRKPVTLLSSVIFVIGAVLMTFAHQYWLLLLGRVVVGVGVGKFETVMLAVVQTQLLPLSQKTKKVLPSI